MTEYTSWSNTGVGTATERRLQQALDLGEIVPFFQPILHLASKELQGYEVLARWRHPEQGLLLPLSFLPLFQQRDMGCQLTEHLLRLAFQSFGVPMGARLSMNVSPTLFKDRALPSVVERVAAQEGYPLRQLTIEITEDALLDNSADVSSVASELKELGVGLALDDFGTGFSSLSHLQAVPLDQIKIDQSFIRNMTEHRSSRKIVAAVIGLGRTLGLETVAEGVEQKEQADMLVCLGCDLVQGWRFGRPGPAEQYLLKSGLDLRRPEPVVKNTAPLPLSSQICLEALPTERYAQLRAIYDGAPVGLCFLDRKLRYVSMNRRLAAMHDMTVQENLGRSIQEVRPLLYEKVKGYLLNALAGIADDSLELQGSEFSNHNPEATVLVSFEPARDEADEIQGVSVAVIDISESKRQERLIGESEARLQAVIDAMPVGIAIAEAPSGRIICRNPAAQRILCQDPLTFDRMSAYSDWVSYFYNGARLPSEEFPMARAIKLGLSTELSPVFCDLGAGRGKWLKLAGIPIHDKNHSIMAALVTIEEVREPHVGVAETPASHTAPQSSVQDGCM